MAGRFELRVSPEELARLRRERGLLKERLRELEKLEETLRVLRYRYLLERINELEVRLREMEEHYNSLVEFERMATEDKKWLMEVRKELSRENHELEGRVKLENRS